MPTPLQTPVRTVLRTIKRHGIRVLLKGGQACILFGASEFSREVDIAIFAHPENPARSRVALHDPALGQQHKPFFPSGSLITSISVPCSVAFSAGSSPV